MTLPTSEIEPSAADVNDAPQRATSMEQSELRSLYVADAQTARRSLDENPGSRWHQKDLEARGAENLACKRLHAPLFTPFVKPGFKISPADKFFAIGSCFARALENTLLGRKMTVLSVAREFASFQTTRKEVTAAGFTNKYNTYSIYNELRWALDPSAEFPRDTIVDAGHGFVWDPHTNPTLPLADAEETWRRRLLIETVNRRAAECRVVIITLGLVEVWRDTHTGVFINTTPLPPVFDRHPDRYEVHVTSFEQNLKNLEAIHSLLSQFGHEDTHIVVTVSPVPLMATFSGSDIVLANTYSKSLLRAVAQHWAAAHENVHYFPSYEIVQNSERSRAWERDLRHVVPETTRHVMRLFLNAHLEA